MSLTAKIPERSTNLKMFDKCRPKLHLFGQVWYELRLMGMYDLYFNKIHFISGKTLNLPVEDKFWII